MSIIGKRSANDIIDDETKRARLTPSPSANDDCSANDSKKTILTTTPNNNDVLKKETSINTNNTDNNNNNNKSDVSTIIDGKAGVATPPMTTNASTANSVNLKSNNVSSRSDEVYYNCFFFVLK
jgi:hypothetical protein